MSEETYEVRESSAVGLLLAFLAGAAVGAVAAMLTTTKTGPEMRASIKTWAKGLSGNGDVEQHAREAEGAAGGYDRPLGT